MADETAPDKPKAAKPEARKRELKSVKRKGGPPSLKKKPKKSKKWWWLGGGVFVIFALAVFFVPKIGTVNYGICKTYIELHDPYPESLEYVQADEFQTQVTIDYNRIDAFGERSLNHLRCYFKTGDRPNEIASVDLNGKANIYGLEAPEEVAKFNLGVPALLANKPSLVMPKGFADDIKKYK